MTQKNLSRRVWSSLFGASRRNHSDRVMGRHTLVSGPKDLRGGKFKLEQLEERTLLSTIVWTNRGQAGDNFDALFGAGAPAQAARASVDAAIDAWNRVVVNFNHAAGVAGPSGYDLELTISMDAPGANTGCGASTSTTIGADGKPIQGSQNFGNCGGNGSGWFIDPTPNDNSEFAGTINNAFTGTAQAGSAAAGLSDLYSIVLAELTHNMGICNSGCGAALYNANGFWTDTGIADDTPNVTPGPGNFYLFQGATIDALMTNNNGGSGGSAAANPLHTAQARTGNASITFGGSTVFGADDNGNCCGPTLPGTARTLVSNRTALILKDAYGYDIIMPETFGSMYAILNETTGLLTVRGGADNTLINNVNQGASSDVISIGRDGDSIVVSVDVGVDVPGTGTNRAANDQQDAFVIIFDAGQVRSLSVQAGAGDDSVTIAPEVGLAATIDPGTGNDRVYTGSGPTTVTSVAGDGDDLIDFSNNPVGITFTVNGGDSVIGTRFNDTLVVDSTAGLITSPIHFDGGAGFDQLTLQQTGGATQTSDTYSVGPNPGEGISTIVGAGGTQQVFFQNLEPVLDTVPAASLIVIATSASNAINYSQGSVAANGLVTIDNFESIEFSNKSTLVINAGSGSDEINLNNPNTPSGLTGDCDAAVAGNQPICVNGGDPTASDRLIVNGTTGNDSVNFSPTASDTGTISGAGPVAISAISVEDLHINMQGGANDLLTLTTPAGFDVLEFFPGETESTGRIDFTHVFHPPTLGMSFSNLVGFFVGSGLSLADAGGGRVDELIYQGRDLANAGDTISVDGTAEAGAGTIKLFPSLGGPQMAPVVITPGIDQIILRGLAGDDVFSIRGPLPYGANLQQPIDGGDGFDAIFAQGASGALQASFAQHLVIGYGTLLSYLSVEVLDLDAGGNAVTVISTGDADVVTYLPTGTDAATITVQGRDPVVNFSSVGEPLTVSDGGVSSFDELVVLGTGGDDVVTSTATTVTVNSLQAVTIGAGIDRLDITTFAGNDSITLTGLTVPVVVDAGDGNDSISGSATVTAAMTIFGGDGNDSLLGGNANDSIYGGRGDDTIIGDGGNDQEYGEAGNDRFGDALTTGNGVADDPGNDTASGGDGIDQFIWEPGDGSDLDQGGDDGADILRFFGTAAVNDTFQLQPAAGAPTHVNIVLGAATVDTHGVEQVNVTGLSGGDSVFMADLTPTEVAHVLVDFTSGAGETDRVVMDLRDTNDDVTINTTAAGTVNVLGLEYDVRILNTSAADDTLEVRARDGDDVIKAVNNVEAQIQISLQGGQGNDFLSADATLDGGAGNDMLVGGTGNDSYLGGAGDDVLVVSGGTDTMAGGSEFDVILYQGTAASDNLTLTQAATTITVSGLITGTIDVSAADLEQVNVVGDGGNDMISGSNTIALSMDIRGGDGNDSLLGGNVNDSLYGGFGDDTIIGAAGNDQEYGEAGNDRFGDALTTGNGVADDAGNDTASGGDGIDQFIWEPGDGSDLDQGGDDGADILRFFGTAAVADAISLTPAAGAPTHLNIILGAATVDTHGVEQINVTGLTGGDTFTIADLTPTEVEHVLVDVTAGDADSVIVNARDLNDDILVSTEGGGQVNVLGLEYDVRLLNVAAGAGSDTLTVNGNDGNDVIKSVTGVEAQVNVSLSGGQGDDSLSADATLNGGAGADFLEGGSGDDSIIGGDGEDTMIGLGGLDTFDGGNDFDTILIRGTSGNDTIFADQIDSFTLQHTVNGDLQTDTFSSVEQASVAAGQGDDLIGVRVADSLVATPATSLRFTVEGGDPHASDRLSVIDDGAGDLVIQRIGQNDGSGSVTVGSFAPVVYNDVEFVDVLPLDTLTAGTGSDGLGRLVVFKHDPFESNNARPNATLLGADHTINVDPTIDPGPVTDPFGIGQDLPGDVDFYQFEAQVTGTLDFQIFFEQIGTLANGRAGLPSNGDLDITVFDASGDFIASSSSVDDDERVRIPAVQGQIYLLQVSGFNGAINVYSMTVVNEAPPAPFDIELADAVNSAYDCTAEGNVAGAADPSSDTGRSQFDDVTCNERPTIFLRLDEATLLNDLPGNATGTVGAPPPDRVIPIAFNSSTAISPVGLAAGFRVAIYDEGDTHNPVLVGFAQPVNAATNPGLYTFTFNAALADGSHFITARVQMIDPADNDANAGTVTRATGFGPRSQSLEIVVDTVAPPIAQTAATTPNLELDRSSDTGVVEQETTHRDRATSDTTPSFFGFAEANSVVRLYVDVNANGAVDAGDILVAETVALPYDGTNQFGQSPPPALSPNIGRWTETANVDLNNSTLGFPLDGRRVILATFEDLAGNESAPVALEIFIDTRGPQVTSVLFDPIDAALPEESVFGVKPLQSNAPTPLTRTIVVNMRDLPARATGSAGIAGGPFLYGAVNSIVAESRGQYVLTGDLNGIIAISSIVVINPGGAGMDGQIPTARIELNFNTPLPDDRYSLTVSDAIVDDVGNALDGQSNSREPLDVPIFPTGDGQPGGDYVARFTVDSRPEIGTFCCGSWYIDLNGNGQFDDPNNHDTDFTNADIVYKFGLPGDFPVVGDWDGNGFDEIGVYGRRSDGFRFELDLNGNGAFDSGDATFLFASGGRPVAGAWNPGQGPEDHVAVFSGTTWFVDTSSTPYTSATASLPATTIATTARGRPIAADFNGDGDDDAGLYQNGVFTLDFSSDDNFLVDTPITFTFGSALQVPVAADWDADRDGNIGLFLPDRNGIFPREAAEWYLDLGTPFTGPLGPTLSNLFGTPGGGTTTASPGDGLFQPPPTGGLPSTPNLPYVFQDLFYQFGDELSEPIVGNFDPPPSTPIVNPRPPVLSPDHANAAGTSSTPLIIFESAGEAADFGAIEARTDKDTFQFTPTESGRVGIGVVTPESSLDSTVQIFTRNGRKLRQIASNTNFGSSTDSYVELQATAGTTYFIVVSGARRTTGDYKILVDALLADPGADDHGDTPTTATELTFGGEGQHVAANLNRATDFDYFRFTASVNGRLEFNVAAFTPSLDSVLEVYDVSLRLLASNDNAAPSTTDSHISLDVVAGQTYYIRVRSNAGRRGDYELALDYVLAGGV